MDALTPKQINQFIDDGFVKIEKAFSTEIAEECVAILWKETGCDPDRPITWTTPVVRVGELRHESFLSAANTPILHRAFDQLVGKDNWHPRTTLGSFPIRFPSTEKATDTGWHVDASFPGENASSYFDWRVNIHSKGRGLLMLFLFSDVSPDDAPTLVKIGSHLAVAKILEPYGEKGLSFMDLAARITSISGRSETTACGKAGTVYLCHPFMVHAAQNHRGTSPKFMAQPALLTKNDFSLVKSGENNCPVVTAILNGLKN